jgi:protein-S-isoprenylcysteine O-methyltransferase Ste14
MRGSGAAADDEAVQRRRAVDEAAELSPREEAAIYAVVALALVVLGAVVRTPLLNWICGPAFVVGGVAALASVQRWRKARR